MNELNQLFNKLFPTQTTKGIAIGGALVFIFWFGWNIGRILGGM